jgi:DmsE family decaheme c-type cytochrome
MCNDVRANYTGVPLGRRGGVFMKAWTVIVALLVAGIFAPGSSAQDPPSAGPPPSAVAAEECAACHGDAVKAMSGTGHGALSSGCAGCHGDVSAHLRSNVEKSEPGPIVAFSKLKPQAANEVCEKCHSKAGQKHWSGSSHESRGVACVACHAVHPKGAVPGALLVKPQMALCTGCHLQKKAQLMRSSHMPMREGKLECSTCHNPHGTPNDKLLLQTSVNENCYSCHAEKRGPFLWEHAPVRENCLNCHDAHGSIQEKMLKVKQPLLCQQCHQTASHPGPAYPAMSRYAFNQGCLHCHPTIHGSTHPSGNRFFR